MPFVKVEHPENIHFKDVPVRATFLESTSQPTAVYIKMNDSEALRVMRYSILDVKFDPDEVIVPVELVQIVCKD